MLDLLNASLPYRTVYILLVVLGILLFVEVLIFAILLIRSRSKFDGRQLVDIALDASIVQRKFKVGEEFACNGLVVHATYNIEPTSENIVDYVVLTEKELKKAKFRGKLDGCYVVKPNMNEIGEKTVTVLCQDKAEVYSIEIEDNVEETAVPDLEVQTERMLCGITLDIVVVQRVFALGEEFNCEGLVINAQYNVKPKYESFVDYQIVDREQYDRMCQEGGFTSRCVIKPDMNQAGDKTVFVYYSDQVESYTITVNGPVAEPAVEDVSDTSEPEVTTKARKKSRK